MPPRVYATRIIKHGVRAIRTAAASVVTGVGVKLCRETLRGTATAAGGPRSILRWYK